jgi:hypothetical protein
MIRMALAVLSIAALPFFCGCAGVTSAVPPVAPTQPPATPAVMVLPSSASVATGGSQQFSATVTNESNTAVNWSVNGVSGGNATVGTISTAGLYTAPQNVPEQATVTIQATSDADASVNGAAAVTIISSADAVWISVVPATANVELGAMQSFAAQVSGAQGSTVTWSVSGAGCSGAACGTVDANGNYVAPQILPLSQNVTVTAALSTNSSKTATAAVTVTSRFAFNMTGPASVNAGASANYVAALTPVANSNPSTAISWSVSDAGCSGAECGTLSPNSVGTTATFQAPAAAPSPNEVTITATPLADATKSVSLVVTIIAQTVVTVTPATATIAIGATQIFTAQVTGTSNTDVTWDVNGIVGGNSTIGTVTNAPGTDTTIYTTPSSLPSPATVTIHATSAANSSAVGQASVTLASNPNAPAIIGLLPASGFAGGPGGFTLSVQGVNFVAGSPGPGSVIIIGGTPRQTSCGTTANCTTSLTAADIATPGNLSVQIQNPDATFGNTVSYVVVQETTASDVVALTPASPTVTDKDISVVEPSTAGSAAPQSNVTLAFAAMGIYDVSSGSCSLGAGAITITPPATGSTTVDICVFSVSGLDPSFTYTLTGPAAADVTIVAEQPLGLGIVDLTLSVPSSALAGRRSLFVENPAKDKAVASGVLEVQ